MWDLIFRQKVSKSHKNPEDKSDTNLIQGGAVKRFKKWPNLTKKGQYIIFLDKSSLLEKPASHKTTLQPTPKLASQLLLLFKVGLLEMNLHHSLQFSHYSAIFSAWDLSWEGGAWGLCSSEHSCYNRRSPYHLRLHDKCSTQLWLWTLTRRQQD